MYWIGWMPNSHIYEYPSAPFSLSKLAGVTVQWTCIILYGSYANCHFKFEYSTGRIWTISIVIQCFGKKKSYLDETICPLWYMQSSVLIWAYLTVIGWLRGTMLHCIYDVFWMYFLLYYHLLHSYTSHLVRQCLWMIFDNNMVKNLDT